MKSGKILNKQCLIIEHVICRLLMLLFDMANFSNLSSKGKQKVLIIEKA